MDFYSGQQQHYPNYTRMKTSIKAKLKILDEQININIILYQNQSSQESLFQIYDDKALSSKKCI